MQKKKERKKKLIAVLNAYYKFLRSAGKLHQFKKSKFNVCFQGVFFNQILQPQFSGL
jgi:hypothetical protein